MNFHSQSLPLINILVFSYNQASFDNLFTNCIDFIITKLVFLVHINYNYMGFISRKAELIFTVEDL